MLRVPAVPFTAVCEPSRNLFSDERTSSGESWRSQNLAELAEASAERLGERSIYEIDGEQFTNWQLLDRGQRLHAALAELGLGRGGRAVVLMMNHALVYPVFQGIFRCGGTAIPVMPQAAAAELRYVLADTEAQLVVTDVERLPTVREAVAGLPHVRHILVQGGDGQSASHAARDPARCAVGLRAADLACRKSTATTWP